MDATEVLHFERLDGVAMLTLDRPERLNAIGSDTVALLHEALDSIEADHALRAIVITGAGRAFSAGADITELDTLKSGADFGRFVNALTDVFDRLAACAAPSIAAINGIALGGGCELALACDLRLAAPGARLGVPEVKLGLLPGASGTQRLARLLPAAITKHMLMTGAPISAEAAAGPWIDQRRTRRRRGRSIGAGAQPCHRPSSCTRRGQATRRRRNRDAVGRRHRVRAKTGVRTVRDVGSH